MSRITEKDMENGRAASVHRRVQPPLHRRRAGEFTVQAKNLRGVIKDMDRLYPGLGEHLKERPPSRSTARSTTIYFQPIREGCEIFFIPKLEGG